jgi:hypothetical protein
VPQRTPGLFRKLDAVAVLTAQLLPAPLVATHPEEFRGLMESEAVLTALAGARL